MPRGQRRRIAAIALGGMLGLVTVAAGLRVVAAFQSGEAGKPFRTVWGIQWSYTGAVVFFVVAVLGTVVGGAYAWWEGRHERDFDRRYPPR